MFAKKLTLIPVKASSLIFENQRAQPEMFAIFHGCNLGINLLSQQSYLVRAEIPHCIDKEMPQKA